VRAITVGFGETGCKITEALSENRPKFSKEELFTCFAISDNLEFLSSLEHIESENRFPFMTFPSKGRVEGVINEILSIPEFYETYLLITDIFDDFGYHTMVEFIKCLREKSDEPIITLNIVPPLHKPRNLSEMKKRLITIRKIADVLILFENKGDIEKRVVEPFNILAAAGELEARGEVGEVVVDTSDIINSIKDGITVMGFAKRDIPPEPFRFIKKVDFKKQAERTMRMVELLKEAMTNLSLPVDISDASSALFIFSAHPDELTFDGYNTCLSLLAELNPKMRIRYGDFPLKKSDEIVALILFSGIRRIRF